MHFAGRAAGYAARPVGFSGWFSGCAQSRPLFRERLEICFSGDGATTRRISSMAMRPATRRSRVATWTYLDIMIS
jgi:hypothetical protein